MRSATMTDNFDKEGGEHNVQLLEDYLAWSRLLGTKWAGRATFRTFVLPADRRPKD